MSSNVNFYSLKTNFFNAHVQAILSIVDLKIEIDLALLSSEWTEKQT